VAYPCGVVVRSLAPLCGGGDRLVVTLTARKLHPHLFTLPFPTTAPSTGFAAALHRTQLPPCLLHQLRDHIMALAGPLPATAVGKESLITEQLLKFARRHDFTSCPPVPSRRMPHLASPVAPSPQPHKRPMFTSFAEGSVDDAGLEGECQVQPAMEMLEAHLRSVLPIPSSTSSSSYSSMFSSLFVSPQSSPTISRLLSSAGCSSSTLSPYSPSKLSQAMKKHVRPTKEEKDYFKHLFSSNRKKASGKKKDTQSVMMDDDEVGEWREQLEQFEVSKYFVGPAASTTSRSRWQMSLMLAYRDADRLSSSSSSPSSSPPDTTKKRKRKSSGDRPSRKTRGGNDDSPKRDVYGRDRGAELQAAARLVVEMNHLWDLAHRLVQGQLDASRLRRAKDRPTWTIIDSIPSKSVEKTTTTPTKECGKSAADKASFRITLMSSLGFFTNSVLPSSPSSTPPSSPSPSSAGPAQRQRRPSATSSSPQAPSPSSADSSTFGCPSFPSTPGTARLRPRPAAGEPQLGGKKNRQPTKLSVAEGGVVSLLLADLLVKQMCYELCLSGTLARVVNDAQ
jgi:hypothetical protein